MRKKYDKNENHYHCLACDWYFPTAPKGTCPNGHTFIRAFGWDNVIEPLREKWLKGGRNNEN